MLALALVLVLPAGASAAIPAPVLACSSDSGNCDDGYWWQSAPTILPTLGAPGTPTVACSLRRTENIPAAGAALTTPTWTGSGTTNCGGSQQQLSPKLPAMTDGWYRFDYSVTNSSGTAKATINFGIDTVKPGAVTFTYQSTGGVVDPAFDFSATDARSGVVRYDCRTTKVGDTPSDAGWADCFPPFAIGWNPIDAEAGAFVLEVRAEDAAGNQASSISSRQFTQVTDTPVATAAPVMSASGALIPGATLTLNGYGTWPTIDFWTGFDNSSVGEPFERSVTWYRCGADGAGCVEVPLDGLLDGSYVLDYPLSYPVTTADVGKRIKAVTTIGFCSTADPESCTPPSAPMVLSATVQPTPPPVATKAPTLSGAAVVGTALKAVAGSWTGGTATRVWERCTSAASGCSTISGVSGLSYTLVAADLGKYVRVRETATGLGGTTQSSSGSVGVVLPATVVVTASADASQRPLVDGTVSVTVRCDRACTVAASLKAGALGPWSSSVVLVANTDTVVKVSIPSAGQTALLSALASGYPLAATIGVKVTAASSTSPADKSLAVGLISPIPAPSVVKAPAVSGVAIVGGKLAAVAGSWSSGTVVRIWQRCTSAASGCSTISGVSGLSYTLVAADQGKYIRVRETATNYTGSAQVTSNSSGPTKPKRR